VLLFVVAFIGCTSFYNIPMMAMGASPQYTTSPYPTVAAMPNQQQQQQHLLPPGVEMMTDPVSGRVFYIDHNTKTTSWDPPIIIAKQ